MIFFFYFISVLIGFMFILLFCKFLVDLSEDSPEMKRKRWIKKMNDAGFKRNELGHWVK